MTFRVMVDDNYHYMDETERYTLGEFESLEAAIDACKRIVDDYLESAYKPGMSAEELCKSYKGFGDDPWIIGPDPGVGKVLFSAWDYADHRCVEICKSR